MALVSLYILINTLNINRFIYQKAQGGCINFLKSYLLPMRDSLSFKDTYRLKQKDRKRYFLQAETQKRWE